MEVPLEGLARYFGKNEDGCFCHVFFRTSYLALCPVTLLSIMLLWSMSTKAWLGYILTYKP